MPFCRGELGPGNTFAARTSVREHIDKLWSMVRNAVVGCAGDGITRMQLQHSVSLSLSSCFQLSQA
eukprot:2603595-Amphidinium_carterae.1